MKRTILFIFSIFLLGCYLNAQSFLTDDDYMINGYAKRISGLDYDYQSCIPGLRESMLVRALNGKDFMEWETDPVPSHITKKYATFIWVAALGSSPGKSEMVLNLNDDQNYLFHTDGLHHWEVKNPDGSSLSFNSIMVDQNGDNHGYMILRIPAKQLIAGKTLKLKVTGGKNNLTSWYMTFKKEVKTGVTMNAFPAIIKKGSEHLQLIELGSILFRQGRRSKNICRWQNC